MLTSCGCSQRESLDVERRRLGQPLRAVAGHDLEVVIAQRRDALGGGARQRLVPLDRVHPARDAAQHRRRIARAGADLEHAVAGSQLGRLGHHRHDVRLRDRLAFVDGQRRVLVGELGQRLAHESLARHLAHRRQHPLVAHAAAGDVHADHVFALLSVVGPVVGHACAVVGSRVDRLSIVQPANTIPAQALPRSEPARHQPHGRHADCPPTFLMNRTCAPLSSMPAVGRTL